MRVTKLRRLHFAHRRILDMNIVNTTVYDLVGNRNFFSADFVKVTWACVWCTTLLCFADAIRMCAQNVSQATDFYCFVFVGQKELRTPAFSLAYDRQHNI